MIPAGLPVAGIGSQRNTSSIRPPTIANVAAGFSRMKGAIAWRPVVAMRAGPANHAATTTTLVTRPSTTAAASPAPKLSAPGRETSW